MPERVDHSGLLRTRSAKFGGRDRCSESLDPWLADRLWLILARSSPGLRSGTSLTSPKPARPTSPGCPPLLQSLAASRLPAGRAWRHARPARSCTSRRPPRRSRWWRSFAGSEPKTTGRSQSTSPSGRRPWPGPGRDLACFDPWSDLRRLARPGLADDLRPRRRRWESGSTRGSIGSGFDRRRSCVTSDLVVRVCRASSRPHQQNGWWGSSLRLEPDTLHLGKSVVSPWVCLRDFDGVVGLRQVEWGPASGRLATGRDAASTWAC